MKTVRKELFAIFAHISYVCAPCNEHFVFKMTNQYKMKVMGENIFNYPDLMCLLHGLIMMIHHMFRIYYILCVLEFFLI
jgi:hypothetical protein